MGYTNYWTRQSELPAKRFAAAVKDIKKIMKHLGVPLAGGDGTGSPIFGAGEIIFNGATPSDYETFAIARTATARADEPKVFEFCKTEHRPYDIGVQAALIVLKHHLGEAITASSDGDGAAWDKARAVCQKWLGYGRAFRLGG